MRVPDCPGLHKPQKAFIFQGMNTRSQALAVTQLLPLTSTLLLAGLLLRASAN
jgi:hypothetical protein